MIARSGGRTRWPNATVASAKKVNEHCVRVPPATNPWGRESWEPSRVVGVLSSLR